MKEEILGAVVEVEKEITAKLEQEKTRIHERLMELRNTSDERISAEKERLNGALQKSIADSITDAEKRAAEILKDAGTTAGKLDTIGDEVLKTIIRKHIHRILP